jgi:hypothetical protein
MSCPTRRVPARGAIGLALFALVGGGDIVLAKHKGAVRGDAVMAYASRFGLGEMASPRKTRIACLRRRISSSSRWPMREPILDFGTVVILSTINRERENNRLRSLRNVSSLINALI